MGTYTDFSVAGYSLIDSKSSAISEVMTIFRESDKRIFERRLNYGDPFVCDHAHPDEANEFETVTEYACSTNSAMDRLDVMGFTIERARREYELERNAEIAKYQEWAKGESDPPWFAKKVTLLSALSFTVYLDALTQVVAQKLRTYPFDDDKLPGLTEAIRYILEQNDDYLYGFFAPDTRCFIRVVCEVAAKPSEVIQDISTRRARLLRFK